jgi:hypothetical protein
MITFFANYIVYLTNRGCVKAKGAQEAMLAMMTKRRLSSCTSLWMAKVGTGVGAGLPAPKCEPAGRLQLNRYAYSLVSKITLK